ncbi:unnamed protein product [Dicrocoelium dendriticum]|nr:unnamed protein product [Dicrocoelium dendriticum]
MLTPTFDPKIINQRLDAVEFLSKPSSVYLVEALRKYLKQMSNIPRIFCRMQQSSALPKDWKRLMQSIISLKELIHICAKFSSQLYLIRELVEENVDHGILTNIRLWMESIIDFELTSKQQRFSTNNGLDPQLDESFLLSTPFRSFLSISSILFSRTMSPSVPPSLSPPLPLHPRLSLSLPPPYLSSIRPHLPSFSFPFSPPFNIPHSPLFLPSFYHLSSWPRFSPLPSPRLLPRTSFFPSLSLPSRSPLHVLSSLSIPPPLPSPPFHLHISHPGPPIILSLPPLPFLFSSITSLPTLILIPPFPICLPPSFTFIRLLSPFPSPLPFASFHSHSPSPPLPVSPFPSYFLLLPRSSLLTPFLFFYSLLTSISMSFSFRSYPFPSFPPFFIHSSSSFPLPASSPPYSSPSRHVPPPFSLPPFSYLLPYRSFSTPRSSPLSLIPSHISSLNIPSLWFAFLCPLLLYLIPLPSPSPLNPPPFFTLVPPPFLCPFFRSILFFPLFFLYPTSLAHSPSLPLFPSSSTPSPLSLFFTPLYSSLHLSHLAIPFPLRLPIRVLPTPLPLFCFLFSLSRCVMGGGGGGGDMGCFTTPT